MKEIVKIEGLNYTYPDGTRALEDINLNLFEGESLGLIGPNGAGKSTLLLHINGILKGEGRIKVLGLGLNDKNLNLIRSKVGLVFQYPENQLFMPTVFDDVSFGPINLNLKKDEVQNRVREALQVVGMLDSGNKVTHHLIFGEKKRVSIANILAMRPEILLLD